MKILVLSSLVIFGTSAFAYVASEERASRLLERVDQGIRLTNAGNYGFVNCDAHQSNILTNALNALYSSLLPVIEDAKNSQAQPSSAYKTFIKNPDRAQFVADLITNVTIGNAMYPPIPPLSNGGPTFICVTWGMFPLTQSNGRKFDAYRSCLETQFTAAYLYPSPWIIVCPVFWRLRPSPPRNACPKLSSRTNSYIRRKKVDYDRAGSSITQNHIWILMEEIVHFYLFAQPGYVMLDPEVLDINSAWMLTAEKALRNAVNHVYYAASKFYPPTPDRMGCGTKFKTKAYVAVSMDCTKWPRLAEDDGRDLLEGGGGAAKLEDQPAVDVISATSISSPS
ncbi:MAG: hypothetical protein Q9213_001525 [Squamulea squamosa]